MILINFTGWIYSNYRVKGRLLGFFFIEILKRAANGAPKVIGKGALTFHTPLSVSLKAGHDTMFLNNQNPSSGS